MEYVIRDQKEKPKETEVWLRQMKNGRIVFVVGAWNILSLDPDGKVCLLEGVPEHNKEGIQVDEYGRIKVVE